MLGINGVDSRVEREGVEEIKGGGGGIDRGDRGNRERGKGGGVRGSRSDLKRGKRRWERMLEGDRR